MKKKKVFIEDYGPNGHSVNLPFHYNKANCEVYMLKPGEFPTLHDWSKFPVWPRLLFKPHSSANVRNFDEINLSEDEIKYGEDFFLIFEKDDLTKNVYADSTSVTLLTEKDLKLMGKEIDVYHTSEFCKSHLTKLLPWAEQWLPNAKWVSSCFDPADFYRGDGKHVGPKDPQNVCTFIPSLCEGMFSHTDKNQIYLFRNDFEFDYFCIDRNRKRDMKKFASFMHNYHVRDPELYRVYTEMQKILAEHGIELKNYGGNIRGVGADLRYNHGGETGKGPSGSNFETLSPKKSRERYFEINSALHLKGLDWAGGVPAHSQMAGTPFITSLAYLQNSNYLKYYNESTGTVASNKFSDLLNAIVNLSNDSELHKHLSISILSLKDNFFTTDYWVKWQSFVDNIK